jgi:hypothetical protein
MIDHNPISDISIVLQTTAVSSSRQESARFSLHHAWW